MFNPSQMLQGKGGEKISKRISKYIDNNRLNTTLPNGGKQSIPLQPRTLLIVAFLP
jgi:hypothetical protein